MTAEKKAQVRAAIWQPGYAGDEAKSELLGLLDAAEAEIVAIRAKLEAAPHAPICRWDKGIQWCRHCCCTKLGHLNNECLNAPGHQWEPAEPRTCNCWKADL